MVNFTCKATGEPVPDISWYYNGIMIDASDKSSKYMTVSESINVTTTENTLTIYNATSSDIGIYTCTASNILGNDTSHGNSVFHWNKTVINIVYILRLFIRYGVSNMWLGNKL